MNPLGPARFRLAVFLLLLAAIGASVRAQSAHEDLLVPPQWLHQRLGMVAVLHVGDRAGYDAGHVPGAVLLDPSALVVTRDGIPNELPPVGALERIFRSAGAGTHGRIVLYASDPVPAARAWFTLDYLGHGGRTSLLNGGLAAWVAAGYATSREPVSPKATGFDAHAAPQTVTHLATLRELVRLREQLGPAFALIDARSAAQFCGDEACAGVTTAGHIPGSINIPFVENLDVTGAYRPAGDLRALYTRAGVRRDAAVVVYCRSGMQAAVTYVVLRYLGFDAVLYDGSFLEWSNAGAPVDS